MSSAQYRFEYTLKVFNFIKLPWWGCINWIMSSFSVSWNHFSIFFCFWWKHFLIYSTSSLPYKLALNDMILASQVKKWSTSHMCTLCHHLPVNLQTHCRPQINRAPVMDRQLHLLLQKRLRPSPLQPQSSNLTMFFV